MNNIALANLITFSHTIGQHPEFVQGGGGNTSAKDEAGYMYIKASGSKLSEMNQDFGYTSLDYSAVLQALSELPDSPNDLGIENRFNAQLLSMANPVSFRPSMETAMHACLKRYVIHTHPVHTNILTCLDGGQNLIKQILKDEDAELFWVDYVNPGYNLAKAVSHLPTSKRNSAIFLQNHGLITDSDNANEALDLTIRINELVKSYLAQNFGISQDFTVDELQEELTSGGKMVSFSSHPLMLEASENLFATQLLMQKGIFPDSIVFSRNSTYFLGEPELDECIGSETDAKIIFVADKGVYYFGSSKRVQAMHEILLALFFILRGIKKIGQPHWIHDSDAEYILAMDSEKYRQKITV